MEPSVAISGKIAFKCTTTRSEPQYDFYIIFIIFRFEPYDYYKKNSYKKNVCTETGILGNPNA